MRRAVRSLETDGIVIKGTCIQDHDTLGEIERTSSAAHPRIEDRTNGHDDAHLLRNIERNQSRPDQPNDDVGLVDGCVAAGGRRWHRTRKWGRLRLGAMVRSKEMKNKESCISQADA